MNYFVKVTPRAKEAKVEQTSPNTLHVRVTAAPVDGKANQALIEALAEFFHCAKSKITIKAGATIRTKIIQVTD